MRFHLLSAFVFSLALTAMNCAAPAQEIMVENSASIAFGATGAVQQAQSTLPAFDAGTDTKLVVGFAVENGDSNLFGVTFGGVPLTEVISSADPNGLVAFF